MTPLVVEACVETLGQALAAQAGGAHRLELCANLAAEGTTPPDDLLASCLAHTTLPVFVMIRPRAGSFVYTGDEIDLMVRQIRRTHELGAHGIVTGALGREGRVDRSAVTALVGAAQPLPVTFHRAFDTIPDSPEALEQLLTLGVSRVLTSGRAPTAVKGIDVIARLVRQAADRLTVVAGGGVRAHNVRQILERTGVREVHGRFGVAAEVRAVVTAASG